MFNSLYKFLNWNRAVQNSFSILLPIFAGDIKHFVNMSKINYYIVPVQNTPFKVRKKALIYFSISVFSPVNQGESLHFTCNVEGPQFLMIYFLSLNFDSITSLYHQYLIWNDSEMAENSIASKNIFWSLPGG